MSSSSALPVAGVTSPDSDMCTTGSTYNGRLGLRVAAIFIILFTSLCGTLFPIISRKIRRLHIPEGVYQFSKYFGSGVIIATAFIHLLAPAWEALTSPCLSGTWTVYPWAPAISMTSVFSIFLVELIAHRTGASYLKRRGLHSHDHHSQKKNEVGHSTHGAHVEVRRSLNSSLVDASSSPPPPPNGASKTSQSEVDEAQMGQHRDHDHEIIDESGLAQILGVAILEFGVIFHSLIIGLTLAVNVDFTTLFIVLIFHQTFEGLGLGSRLSVLPLPSSLSWVPYFGAILYSSITPLGIAIGLGVRTTYNPDSATASIVSGVLDAFSSGILLYTGLVELLAHDFIFNREMAVDASNGKVAFSVGCVVLGAGIMALLGRWA